MFVELVDWFIQSSDDTFCKVTFPFTINTRPAAISETTSKYIWVEFTSRLTVFSAISPICPTESEMLTIIWQLKREMFWHLEAVR